MIHLWASWRAKERTAEIALREQSLIVPAMTWLNCCPKPPSTLAPAAQVTAPSVPDRPEELRWFASLTIMRFMTIPVCVPL
jgi:hypothetical protein